jgi:tetratricopeptide (TPR) repeat protein
MVLGIAQYRSGKWADARTSLEKLVELDPDSEHPRTSCFLAMTSWKLGEKEAARQHYNNAVGWIEKSQIDDEITLGFRDEAAELLGIDSDGSRQKGIAAIWRWVRCVNSRTWRKIGVCGILVGVG